MLNGSSKAIKIEKPKKKQKKNKKKQKKTNKKQINESFRYLQICILIKMLLKLALKCCKIAKIENKSCETRKTLKLLKEKRILQKF